MLRGINFTRAAATMDVILSRFLVLKCLLFNFFLLDFQAQSCLGQNDVFLPSPMVKTLQPEVGTSTPLPVTERNLWGMRLWQVAGLAFVSTVVLVTFCCCLCDCRVPKTTYDKEDKPQEDSDCSDTEPAVAVRRAPAMIPEQEPQGGKELVNGSAPQKLHRGFSEHEIGKANSAFENDGEHSALHHENWKGKPRISFSRQP
ncbi:uncharacterized protein LOC111337888 [Stylophora pistillata]|uniref:uncharacterized protein LOC111337888 n=1 Tax=Stylophora pistillata TaxID=50429 RepID=UPI000C03B60A|nr:uncharacterized protein LOC111337888 [Stylophora pistillata]